MNKTPFRRAYLTTLVAASLISATLAPTAFAQEKVRWKIPVAFATNLPSLGDTINYVAEMLDKSSGGNVQFKVFEPGKLVPPFSITDAVKDKKVEAGYTWIGYDQGKIPSSALFASLPFDMEAMEYTAWWFHGEGQKLGDEVYGKHGVKPLLCGITGPETTGWFRNEIKSLEDIKGLKIRFAGIGGKIMQKAGASVTMLPGGEIFQALEKGAIDASEFSMPAVDQTLGFEKLVKYNYFPGWHQPFTAVHLLVNKGVWDGLSESSRALITMACTAGTVHGFTRGEAVQGPIITESEGKGVQVKTLPENVLRELKKLSDEVLAEEAAKDADFKKVLESQQAFIKAYKPWKTLGYLPRNF